MSRLWVVNASPLILLGKIEHVTLLGELSDELVVPAAVVREVGAKPGGDRVIALAGATSNSRAVLDDLEARRCAQSVGLPMIGTLGVVLRAKRRGVIAAARPVIEHLRRVGLYASDQLIERALAHLGE